MFFFFFHEHVFNAKIRSARVNEILSIYVRDYVFIRFHMTATAHVETVYLFTRLLQRNIVDCNGRVRCVLTRTDGNVLIEMFAYSKLSLMAANPPTRNCYQV